MGQVGLGRGEGKETRVQAEEDFDRGEGEKRGEIEELPLPRLGGRGMRRRQLITVGGGE